jgi:hypothetical protein
VPAITESARTSREGLFRELRTARALKLADRQPAQIGRADPGRTRQFVELAPALRLQLDFKSRRGVVCHAAKIRPPAEFPFNAPAFRRRSDAAQRPWQLRRRQKRAPAGAEAKVVLTPEAASHARHQHPYMARQLRRRYEQDGRASGPAATTACIDDAASRLLKRSPRYRRGGSMHHSTPSVAPRQPLLRTRGRYWPFSSVSAAHRFGSNWSKADMAGPAAGSTQSRMTHSGHRRVALRDLTPALPTC